MDSTLSNKYQIAICHRNHDLFHSLILKHQAYYILERRFTAAECCLKPEPKISLQHYIINCPINNVNVSCCLSKLEQKMFCLPQFSFHFFRLAQRFFFFLCFDHHEKCMCVTVSEEKQKKFPLPDLYLSWKIMCRMKWEK